MTIYSQGPSNARIMLIGECFGEMEDKTKPPFQGINGRVLDGILEEVGIPRSLCYITNVIHARPPNNNFGVYYEKNKPKPELLEAYDRLANEIRSVDPHVVVCLGNEALKAVMGFGGIMDWRGSVLTSPCNGTKVIPTIHPEAINREWHFRPAVVSDFEKVKKESEYRENKQTKRESITNPSLETTLEYINEAKSAEYLSFDIETESNQITCIGLSCGLHRGICIPFWFGSSGSYWSSEEETLIWNTLKDLLEADSPKKIAHNGMYEMAYLTRTLGIQPNIHFDTMLMFHTLYPGLPKSLAYVVSLYTDHPFYKFQRHTDKADELWEYNTKDAILTYECFIHLHKELTDSKQLDFYNNYVQSLVEPLSTMTNRGVGFDSTKCRGVREAYEKCLKEKQIEVNTLVGHDLNINSRKQMITWLYDELKLPKQTKKRKETGVETETADEEALKEIYEKHGTQAVGIILEMRKKQKLLSTYLNVLLDTDKRIRCSYNIAGTETGRLSSSSTAFGTGTNLQNVPDGVIRSLFVADDGFRFINADLSQAEARIVAYLSGDQRFIQVFEQGGDIHRKNASNIFQVKESEVTYEQRQLAKRVVHASNYGMGPRTFARTAKITEKEATRLLNQYFATYPRIKIWHMQIRDRLSRTRILVTPFGRKRIFFDRFGDSMFKEGLAYIPQSSVADIVNQALIGLHRRWRGLGDRHLLLQVHDSILTQVKEESVEEAIKEIKEEMTRPFEVNGRIVTIPCDVKTGLNWFELR